MDRPLSDPVALHGAILLGRYRIEALIGQGGMAFVYAGRHLALDREVAIKVLRDRHARRQTVVDRFLQEARAASRVRHEHIAEVTDFGTTPDGIVFMVMERLEGETLADTIQRDGRLGWPRARDIALQLCDALQLAHDHGVVHRDVSLKNCFRMTRGRNADFVKLLDFGIARVIGSETSPNGPLRRLTADTQVMGTPEFMSPEQATRSCAVDSRSDIYAMGVVLYAMLTDTLPFEAATAVDIMARHIYDPVPPPSQYEPTLAPVVEAIVLRALEKDPDRRFQSMTELADALRAVPDDARHEISESSAPVLVSTHVPTPQRSHWRAVRRVAMSGALLGVAWWGWHESGRPALESAYESQAESQQLPELTEAAIVAAPAIAADPIEPRTMRAATVPPSPPPGWLDRRRAPAKHDRRHVTRAQPDATPPVQPSVDEAPEIAAPIEPTPTRTIVPAPPPEIRAIEEVKNPFEQ